MRTTISTLVTSVIMPCVMATMIGCSGTSFSGNGGQSPQDQPKHAPQQQGNSLDTTAANPDQTPTPTPIANTDTAQTQQPAIQTDMGQTHHTDATPTPTPTPPPAPQTFQVACASHDYQPCESDYVDWATPVHDGCGNYANWGHDPAHMKVISVTGGAQGLQNSDAACVQGGTDPAGGGSWGWNGTKVWCNQGCRTNALTVTYIPK